MYKNPVISSPSAHGKRSAKRSAKRSTLRPAKVVSARGAKGNGIAVSSGATATPRPARALRRRPRDPRKPPISRNPVETQNKLVAATLRLMLRQGFAATTIDDICAEATLTKGAFFHYFGNKEAIGHAALERFAEIGTEVYSPSWEDPSLDPLEQVHRHLEIMIGLARDAKDDPVVCMVGMMSQELSSTNSHMRTLCAKHLTTWSDRIAAMLARAKKIHPPKVDFDPAAVAWMLNSLWQGSMLIAKARQRQDMTVTNLKLARAYVDSLFFGTSALAAHRACRRSA